MKVGDSMTETNPAEVIYDGSWHYKGYHGGRSVCHLRLLRLAETGSSVAIFTEIDQNPGTSITNRIEVLATLVWEFLQKPETPPIIVEHYPNRGVHNPHTDQWQFPEQFDLVEFDRKPDGSFAKPRWRRIPRTEVEKLIGQPIS